MENAINKSEVSLILAELVWFQELGWFDVKPQTTGRKWLWFI